MNRKTTNLTTFSCFTLGLVFTLTGCPEDKNKAEKAGDKIEDAGEKAGGKLEEAGDKIEDKIDEAN